MYSDGDDPAKRGKLGMQETLSLNWSGERAVMKSAYGDTAPGRSRCPSS